MMSGDSFYLGIIIRNNLCSLFIRNVIHIFVITDRIKFKYFYVMNSVN